MMVKSRTLFNSALVLVALETSRAAIVADGPWTGKDWYDSSYKMGVQNGVPYSNDPEMQNVLRAPLSLDTSIDNYLSMKNVQLVKDIFPADQWPVAFPMANALYTYDSFLKAVAKFPAFCNDNNIAGNTMEQTCKRELAAVFAHWGQETGKREPPEDQFWKQGLFYIEEISPASCYISYEWGNGTKWPPQSGQCY